MVNRLTINVHYDMYCITGIIRRRCIIDDMWEEFFECFREETGMLLDQVIIAELC